MSSLKSHTTLQGYIYTVKVPSTGHDVSQNEVEGAETSTRKLMQRSPQ